jgi:Domain of unknown function (DUF6531)
LQLVSFHAVAQSGLVWGFDEPWPNLGTAADVCSSGDEQRPGYFTVNTPTPGTNSLPLSRSDLGYCDQTRTGYDPYTGGWNTSFAPRNWGLRIYITTTPYWLDIHIPRPQVCTKNCLADPINPAMGNVYRTEEDVKFASGLGFRRFYNSADATGIDGVLGWRHSFSRSIQTIYANSATSYPGQSATVSPQYSTLSAACTQGFATIQASVSAWATATATYNNGVCVVSTAAGTIASLPIRSYSYPFVPTPPVRWSTTSSATTVRFCDTHYKTVSSTTNRDSRFACK